MEQDQASDLNRYSLQKVMKILPFNLKAVKQVRYLQAVVGAVNYSKKFKDEALNAGKAVAVMKCLMLHRIALSLHSFWCPDFLVWQSLDGRNPGLTL